MGEGVHRGTRQFLFDFVTPELLMGIMAIVVVACASTEETDMRKCYETAENYYACRAAAMDKD